VVISTRPGLNRYLRVTPGGLFRTDVARAKAEENLDGKYLLRTAGPKLSAEGVALGYKRATRSSTRLARHEAGHRPAPRLPPQGERIRAHVILCWLALPLTRITEKACGRTWPELRRELSRIHVDTFTGPAGIFRQRTQPTRARRAFARTRAIRSSTAGVPTRSRARRIIGPLDASSNTAASPGAPRIPSSQGQTIPEPLNSGG
jgi:hypothetical protein